MGLDSNYEGPDGYLVHVVSFFMVLCLYIHGSMYIYDMPLILIILFVYKCVRVIVYMGIFVL